MPPSKADLEFQRKVDELRKATEGLLVPDGRTGALLLAKFLADIAERNERAA
jgi:hypothetical protein